VSSASIITGRHLRVKIGPRANVPKDPNKQAWLAKKNGMVVGNPPHYKLRDYYHRLVIYYEGTCEVWWVHRSKVAVLHFLNQTLGQKALVYTSGENASLVVPFDTKGSWIGRKGGVVGFLRVMLGLTNLQIVGE